VAAPASKAILEVPDGKTLRTFFGPNSPSADLDALDLAKTMSKDRPAEEVWRETGWWNSPNGWVFEVSDHNMRLKDPFDSRNSQYSVDKSYGRLEDVLDHPEFFRALPPNADGTPSYLGETATSYNSQSREPGGFFSPRKAELEASGRDGFEAREVLVHELEHVAQEASNAVSRGSDPAFVLQELNSVLKELPGDLKDYADSMNDLRRQISYVDAELRATPKGDPFRSVSLGEKEDLLKTRYNTRKKAEGTYGKDVVESIDKFRTFVGDFNFNPNERGHRKNEDSAFDLYERDSGEVMARLSASRKDFLPKDRRVIFPEDMLDRPKDTLITKYDLAKRRNDVLNALDNLRYGDLAASSGEFPKYAEGGAVLDPVSKNEVPPGATPEEVRDDVDAKLSKGEYVIPADVVRYLGLDKIEKMINQAKEGLAKLNEQGRIGGNTDPQSPPSDDLPFSPEELVAIDGAEEEVPRMAEGGLVYSPVQTSQSSDIDPETGLPLWMLEQRRKRSRSSNPNPEPAPTPTGLQQTPDKWSAQDLLKYSNTQGSVGSQVGRGIVSAAVPFGALIMRAQDQYLSKKLPSVAEQLLNTGKNPDGSPLSEEDRKGLQGLVTKGNTSDERKPGLLSRLLRGNKESSTQASENVKTTKSSKGSGKSLVSPRKNEKTIYDYE
jgi:hypothetical protein